MSSRVPGRVRVVLKATAKRFVSQQRRAFPAEPRKILVVPTILIGDTLLVTPLLAKLRERYPQAEVTMTVRRSLMPLYARRPYGVIAVPYDPRDPSTVDALLRQGDFDLALVPGDNRHSWLAAAADARWIVAFAGDYPAYKSWPVDEEVPMPARPMAWSDISATLVPGPAPQPFKPGDWPAPPSAPFERPAAGYVVLHVGAGSPLRLWEPEKWRAVGAHFADRGYRIAWSAGPGEEKLVEEIDPSRKHLSYAGKLDLEQLWELLAGASLLITLDTGIAHLAKLVGVATIALFGPGSSVLLGRGSFWRDAPFREVTVPDFPCRDQRTLFKRRIEWVRRCQRSTDECAEPRCMHAIGVEPVLATAAGLLR
jgi:ADP-heptose:LPS heptosyltransferase